MNWRVDLRDAYTGPPSDLMPINLIWSDPPVSHKTDEAMEELIEIWTPHLAKNGQIIFNSQNNQEDWYTWVERQVTTFSNPGDLVVDFFCGESTTGLAAIRNGRAYYGCDIDQTALDKSETRLREFEIANS